MLTPSPPHPDIPQTHFRHPFTPDLRVAAARAEPRAGHGVPHPTCFLERGGGGTEDPPVGPLPIQGARAPESPHRVPGREGWGGRDRSARGQSAREPSIMAATWRIKASCPCLRAWLSQHQNRKRERPGDSQEVGHEARKLTLQGLLSLEGPPEAPGTSATSRH